MSKKTDELGRLLDIAIWKIAVEEAAKMGKASLARDQKLDARLNALEETVPNMGRTVPKTCADEVKRVETGTKVHDTCSSVHTEAAAKPALNGPALPGVQAGENSEPAPLGDSPCAESPLMGDESHTDCTATGDKPPQGLHTQEDDSQKCELVDEVAKAIVDAAGLLFSVADWEPEARAAIHEVLDYIDEHHARYDPLFTDRIRHEVDK